MQCLSIAAEALSLREMPLDSDGSLSRSSRLSCWRLLSDPNALQVLCEFAAVTCLLSLMYISMFFSACLMWPWQLYPILGLHCLCPQDIMIRRICAIWALQKVFSARSCRRYISLFKYMKCYYSFVVATWFLTEYVLLPYRTSSLRSSL